nr:MAG TPA: hypothetical protein [Bacteriophage sp.]
MKQIWLYQKLKLKNFSRLWMTLFFDHKLF